jgi:hypothetical protein
VIINGRRYLATNDLFERSNTLNIIVQAASEPVFSGIFAFIGWLAGNNKV